MAGNRDLASMRVVEDNSTTVLKAFGDAGWIVFIVEQGSQLFKKREAEELNPLTVDNEAYDSVCIKNPLDGPINTWLEAPATIGDKPNIDLLLKALFGRVITTGVMSGVAEPTVADGNTVEVTTVDVNLQPGMAIRAQANSADFITFVTAISTGTGAGGKDQLTVSPGYTIGQLGATDIPAGVHYVPKTGANSGEYPIVQVDQLDDPNDERYGWVGLKVASASWSNGAGQIIKPAFQLLGIEEFKISSETGTITDPQLGSLFVGKNIFIQKDGSDVSWVQTYDVSYDNGLSEIPGAEAPGGIAGYSENRRSITVGLRFKWESSGDRDNYKNGTRFRLASWARVNVGTIGSPDYRYCCHYFPQLETQDLTIEAPNKNREYNLTAKAYPATRANEDSMTLSIV